MRWSFITILIVCAISLIFWSVIAEPIPEGEEGIEAESLTDLILRDINYQAWLNTGAIEWTFRETRNHLWDRERHLARLEWNNCISWIDLSTKLGKIKCGKYFLSSTEAKEKIDEAWELWANDSFWLNPLAKLRDEGTIRKIIPTPHSSPSLLVTYQGGGITPGDSYLWETDSTGRVLNCQMWVQVLPLGGIRFTWDDWITLSTGARISSTHKGFVSVNLTNIKAAHSLKFLYPNEDPFTYLFETMN